MSYLLHTTNLRWNQACIDDLGARHLRIRKLRGGRTLKIGSLWYNLTKKVVFLPLAGFWIFGPHKLIGGRTRAQNTKPHMNALTPGRRVNQRVRVWGQSIAGYTLMNCISLALFSYIPCNTMPTTSCMRQAQNHQRHLKKCLLFSALKTEESGHKAQGTHAATNCIFGLHALAHCTCLEEQCNATPRNKTPQNTSDHNATHHNTTQHNTPQHNRTQHNRTEHNTTQHNRTQHNRKQHNTTRHNTTQPNTTTKQNTTTQHNTTQHNTTQHNTTQHNTTQQNTTQHNTIQHNGTQHNTAQRGKTHQDAPQGGTARHDTTEHSATQQNPA